MAKAWKVKGILPQSSYRCNAQVILAVKIQEVYSWAESIRNPDNIKELHNLRISVKRLRYSMESFAINYDEAFKDLLTILADLQEQLGDIHDCDVAEMVLTDRLQALPDQGDIETDAIGTNTLLIRYREMRDAKYQAFLQQWDVLEEADFKGKLLKIVKGDPGEPPSQIGAVDNPRTQSQPLQAGGHPAQNVKEMQKMAVNDDYVVGVDMGGTKILAAVINAQGEIIHQAKTATKSKKTPDEVINRIAGCIREAVDGAELQSSQIRAIGVGSPGPLDPETGVIIFAPNLGWSNVPLKAKLEADFGIPIFVDNDVNVGTVGEYAFGAGQGVKNLVGIFVGTGIGGGIILDGKLFHGVNKTAGEVGHMIVKADGPQCGCGNFGCLEAVASRTAITRELQKAILKKGQKSKLTKLNGGKLDLIRSQAIAKAVKRGDKPTIKVMQRAAKYLGISVASIVHFLNPEMIVLGGGVIEAMGDSLLDPIRQAAAKYALPTTMDGVQIVEATLGDNAGVIGASVLARQRLSET